MLIKALNNRNFATWIGLISELINAHLPKSEATVFGHLDQTRKILDNKKVSN